MSTKDADWIRLREAAERKGVHQDTMRAWIKRGEIEAKRIGPRLIYVSTASLDRARRPVQKMQSKEIVEYIERLVDEAPPLTPEQRARLAALLRGGAST